jgi:uncharacterized membrane protein
MGLIDALRIVIGSVFVLFVPGYFLTQALFKKDEIDFLERITLSIVMSITAVPLAVLFLNVIFGVKIIALNTVIIILGIVLLSVVYTRYVKGE